VRTMFPPPIATINSLRETSSLPLR
jgi:hypothetical protein